LALILQGIGDREMWVHLDEVKKTKKKRRGKKRREEKNKKEF